MSERLYDNSDVELVKPFRASFERVEKLLNQAYGRTDGFAYYLIKMDGVPYSEHYPVDGWQDDYSMLKAILHKSGCGSGRREYFDHRITQDDIRYLDNFYKRLIKGKDPMAMLGRYGSTGRTQRLRRNGATVANSKNKRFDSRNLTVSQALVMGSALLLAVIAALLVYFSQM
jgi:hypothetical protein